MNAQSFGSKQNDEAAELARLRLFLAKVENVAYGLLPSSATRGELLALAHEARGLKPDSDKRQVVAEGGQL